MLRLITILSWPIFTHSLGANERLQQTCRSTLTTYTWLLALHPCSLYHMPHVELGVIGRQPLSCIGSVAVKSPHTGQSCHCPWASVSSFSFCLKTDAVTVSSRGSFGGSLHSLHSVPGDNHMQSSPLCLPVALNSWQTLPLSSAIIDSSIKHFDVAHISAAATSNFSLAQDFCLQGKGIAQRGCRRASAK